MPSAPNVPFRIWDPTPLGTAETNPASAAGMD